MLSEKKNKARHKRLYTVWFHLKCEWAKQIETEGRLVVSRLCMRGENGKWWWVSFECNDNVFKLDKGVCTTLNIKKTQNCKFYFLNTFLLEYSCFTMLCKFLHTAKWISRMYTYMPSFLDFLSIQATTEHWVEFPVLPSRFSLVIYFIHNSVYTSIPISQFILPPLPFPLWYLYICSLCLCLYFCFANKFINFIFLDSTYRQYYMIFAFLYCISLRMIISRSIQVSACGIISFLSMVESYFKESDMNERLSIHTNTHYVPLYVCTTSLSIPLLMDI